MISREQCREPQCTTKSAAFSTDSSIRSVHAQSTTFTSVPDCSIRRDPLPCREPDRSSINANPQYRRVWGVIRHGASLQRQQRHQEGQQKQGAEGYIDGRMSFEQVGNAETPRESERGERRAETDRDIQALAYSTGIAKASGRAARAMRFCSTGRGGNTVNGDNRGRGARFDGRGEAAFSPCVPSQSANHLDSVEADDRVRAGDARLSDGPVRSQGRRRRSSP